MKELSTHMHVQMQFLLQPLNACMAFTVESWCVWLPVFRQAQGGRSWRMKRELWVKNRGASDQLCWDANKQINCLPGPCGRHSHQTPITSLHKDTWLLLVTCEIIRVNHLTSFWHDHITEAISFFLASHQRQTWDEKKDFFFENSHSRRRRRAHCWVRSRSHAAHMFSKMLTAGKAPLKAEKHTGKKKGFHL